MSDTRLLSFYSAADEATVTDLCNDHPETLNAVCLKLDDMRGPINWYHLGMKLGISGGTLRTFRGPSGCSPSEVILRMIETLRPNISTTEIAATVEQEVPAVAKVLNELPGMKHSFQHSLLASINNTLFSQSSSHKLVRILQGHPTVHFGGYPCLEDINRLVVVVFPITFSMVTS